MKERDPARQLVLFLPPELKEQLRSDAAALTMNMSSFVRFIYIAWRAKERKELIPAAEDK